MRAHGDASLYFLVYSLEIGFGRVRAVVLIGYVYPGVESHVSIR